MGAKGGKVALAPAVAITLSNVTTTTRIGSGGLLTLTGALTHDRDAARDCGSDGVLRGPRGWIGGRRRGPGADDREPHRHGEDLRESTTAGSVR